MSDDERIADDAEASPGLGPPSSASIGLEHPVLRATTPIAFLGLVALLSGRVLAPALAGVGVGMGWLVASVGLLGAVSSQVFAFAAMMTAIVAIMAASRSRLPVVVRVAALTLGGFAVLPTIWALHQPVPELSAALVAGCSSLLALLAAPAAMRVPFARAPGLVVGLVALGGLGRLGAVGLGLWWSHGRDVASRALEATTPAHALLVTAARVSATAAFLADAVAVAVALVWVASRTKKLTSPATLVALVLAAIFTREALVGQGPDAHGVDLLCWRAAVRMLGVPEAALPLGLRVFVSALAPLAAVAALFAKETLAPLAAAVALALAARGALEMPPCALMLMVAALAAALTATDGRALWASLGRARP